MNCIWSKRFAVTGILLAMLPGLHQAYAQQRSQWVTSWAASSQGPFPSGSPVALPDQSFAFPDPAAGANDQTFRLLVRPSVWAGQTRLRFSNAFGTKPVKLDGVFAGLQLSSAAIVPHTNTSVLFSGHAEVSIAPGADIWSDPVTLPFAIPQNLADLAGRKLAVSFHIVGASGPMTWHAKALQTSYIGFPQTGSHGGEESEQAFPLSATSWFFLSAVDMRMHTSTPLVVCFGDSITDGTASTINGDDRWPDVLQRRLSAARPNGIAVVDEGIGSNQILGPATYDVSKPFGGGPAALQRIARDVAALSGVRTVIWFEGINDLSHGVSAGDVLEGFRTGIASLRKTIPGVRIVGATITPSLGSKGDSGTEDTNQRRIAVNEAIRSGNIFDAYVDFDQAVVDSQSGKLKPPFVPNSSIGGPGDNLHPNRAGYQAMAGSISVDAILPAASRPNPSHEERSRPDK
jgi:lysophospholipase L1-like esterase